MVQIIQETNPGGNIGAALGTGLSKGLEALAASRLKQIQDRHALSEKTKAFKDSGYFNDKESAFLAGLPEKTSGPIIKAFLEKGGMQQEQAQEGSQLEQSMAPLQQQPQQKMQAPDFSHKALLDLLGSPSLSKVGLSPSQEQPVAEIMQKAGSNPQQQLTPEQLQVKEGRIAEHQKRKSLGEVLSQPTKAESAKEQIALRKETQPIVDKLTNDKDFADFSDSRINKMENLVKKGSLPNASFYSLFKKLDEKGHAIEGAGIGGVLGAAIGGPVGAIAGGIIGGVGGSLISPIANMLRYAQRQTSPDAEEFEKLSSEFIKGAKALFGSRITDADLNAFLAQIPTLANTDHGKLQIIKNMRITNDISKVKYNELKKILKENGNRRPIDLAFQIEERSKDKIDKLAKEFETVS